MPPFILHKTARSAAMAIDALRRGWPIRIDGQFGAMDLLVIEAATSDSLAAFDALGRADVLVSHERAAVLNITNQSAAASGSAVCIAREARMDLPFATALADPALDIVWPMKGPFNAQASPQPDACSAALVLARHAGLLPAFFVRKSAEDDAALVHTSVAAVAEFVDPAQIALVARAQLPLAANESAQIIAFRSPDDPAEHIALVLGARDSSIPLVRLHSECLTGDVFGSLKCDCGPQLHHALQLMSDAPWGVLLYLRQEGRGIGLINKLRAYQLQDQGFDTVDANIRLGFPIEARDFSIAAQMLRLLNIDAVRLLTNNPDKAAKLAAAGIDIAERRPHSLPANAHNARYLDTKRDRTGHQL
jgi:GTP cyclohydrolase II